MCGRLRKSRLRLNRGCWRRTQVKKAEAELVTLRAEKKELEGTVKKLTRESEDQVKEANKRRERAEAGYEAVRGGVKSLQEGWKREVEEDA